VTQTSPSEYLRDQRELVDAALASVLSSISDCPPVIGKAMQYSVLAGGKRLRPILALTAAETVAQRDKSNKITVEQARDLAMPAACALELIHTYSLIHDDLPAMDDDALRRGQPTCHVIYGEGIAILAGDGLLTEAFNLMAQKPSESRDHNGRQLSDRKLRTIALVASAAGAIGMVGGQAIDLSSSIDKTETETKRSSLLAGEKLRSMHMRKTGALFRASVCAGVVMAGGSAACVASADLYGTELGLAFQIIDDILDVESEPEQLGKMTGKDAVARKSTYPALYGVRQSRRLASECVARAHEALASSGLEGKLDEIANWLLHRTS